MIPYLRRLVAFTVQGVLARAAHVVADREDVQGFAVYREPGGDLTDELRKLRGALALIQRLDARRFRRHPRDIRGILLSDTPTEYCRYGRVAVLNVRAVRERDEASLSGTLVELGAIARILRLVGARPGRERAHRVERRAAKERDAFFVTLAAAGVGGRRIAEGAPRIELTSIPRPGRVHHPARRLIGGERGGEARPGGAERTCGDGR